MAPCLGRSGVRSGLSKRGPREIKQSQKEKKQRRYLPRGLLSATPSGKTDLFLRAASSSKVKTFRVWVRKEKFGSQRSGAGFAKEHGTLEPPGVRPAPRRQSFAETAREGWDLPFALKFFHGEEPIAE